MANKEEIRNKFIAELGDRLSCSCDRLATEWNVRCEKCHLDFGRTICPAQTMAAMIINEQFRQRCKSKAGYAGYHDFLIYIVNIKDPFVGVTEGLKFISAKEIDQRYA